MSWKNVVAVVSVSQEIEKEFVDGLLDRLPGDAVLSVGRAVSVSNIKIVVPADRTNETHLSGIIAEVTRIVCAHDDDFGARVVFMTEHVFTPK